MYVRHEIRVLEGVEQGVQAIEGAGREKVGARGATRVDYVQGRYSASGDSMDEYVPHPKREGGVQGHRVVIGTVEILCTGGQLSALKEFCAPRCIG